MKWFNFKKKDKKPKVKKEKKKKPLSIYDEAREQIRDEMKLHDPETKEYAALVDVLVKVNDAEAKILATKLDPNKTLGAVTQTGTVIGIALLDRHVPLLGKAWSFIGNKLKP